MDILDYIPQIAAAGAMGISILCILRVAGMLKKEQERDEPRPAFLRSIYIFMGFGLVMTLVALGIEFSRFTMSSGDDEMAALTSELRQLESKGYYSLNENGNPAAIAVNAGGKAIVISQPYPAEAFGETSLNLIERAGKYRAVKNNNGKETTYGYIPETELKTRLAGLFDEAAPPVTPPPPPVSGNSPDASTLFAAGRAYTPGRVKRNMKLRLIEDRTRANSRLIDFLSTPSGENENLREEAVKLLMQPYMMDALSEKGHTKLITLLSTNDVRRAPWRYYEAAQVYHSRYHLMDKTVPEDLEQYLDFSRQYLDAFKTKGWTAENHPGEYAYYQSAALALGKELACETCLIGGTEPGQ